ncbi:MAG: hypothetical protein LBU99_05260 [Spirochaetaceae bacterium]|jgi:hypothetical protein|nr:hypothetical protein [Spirochaetaceae bacterium]
MKHTKSFVVFFLFALLLPCFAAPESFSVKNGTGLIWTDPSGAVSYTAFGVKAGDTPVFMTIDGGKLSSSLAFADVIVPFVRVQTGLRIGSAGFNITGGYASYSELLSKSGEYQFSSDGAGGGFIAGDAFFSIRKITVKPSFLYASADWENGDLYWFFGKPDIHSVLLPAISLVYDGMHSATVRAVFLDGGLLNNKAQTLGKVDIQVWNLEYRFTFDRPGFLLESSLGWLYGDGDGTGALTPANQSYFAFPYTYFNFNGTGTLHIGYGWVSADIGKSFFRFRISTGLVQLLYGDISYSYQSKEKRLFGGRENALSQKVDFAKKPGALFLNLDAGVRDVPLSRQLLFSGGLRKAFIIPWNITSDSSGGGEIPFADSGLIRTILLSGLSFYVKLAL